MSNPVSRVLEWLRAGYPEGVPSTDYLPLFALLQRTLDPQDVEEIVETVIRRHPEGGITLEDVREAAAQRKAAAVTEQDIRQVSARLAAVGWPLSSAPDGEDLDREARPRTGVMAVIAQDDADAGPSSPGAGGSTNPAQKVLSWLTAGYPEGIPPTDRVPLMALLRRRLTDEEVAEVATQLIDSARDGEIQRADAGTLITKVTDDLPSDRDMNRVAAHLAAKGWPLRRSPRG